MCLSRRGSVPLVQLSRFPALNDRLYIYAECASVTRCMSGRIAHSSRCVDGVPMGVGPSESVDRPLWLMSWSHPVGLRPIAERESADLHLGACGAWGRGRYGSMPAHGRCETASCTPRVGSRGEAREKAPLPHGDGCHRHGRSSFVLGAGPEDDDRLSLIHI